jgi:hypothetical protein
VLGSIGALVTSFRRGDRLKFATQSKDKSIGNSALLADPAVAPADRSSSASSLVTAIRLSAFVRRRLPHPLSAANCRHVLMRFEHDGALITRIVIAMRLHFAPGGIEPSGAVSGKLVIDPSRFECNQAFCVSVHFGCLSCAAVQRFSSPAS